MTERDAVPVAARGITLPCPNCGRPWTVDMATNTKLACPRCEGEAVDPAPRPGDAGGPAATMGTDVAALRVACRCLYLEVPQAVGDDVQRKAEAVIARIAALEAALSEDAVERLSAAVHEGWMAHQRAAGFFSSRSKADGEEFMVPYADLSEGAKEIDRATVRAVLAAQRAALAGAGEGAWQ